MIKTSWLLLIVLVTGCALAPGMRMNTGAVDDRAKRSGSKEPGVHDITPELLVRMARERAAAVKPAVDPLGDEAARYQYRVAPYDVLSVTVWDHPELTIPAGEFRSAEATGHPVSADGTFFYPHVGVLRVAGLTLPEIRGMLAEKLTRYVTNPQLDVKVAAFRGKKVQITGEVLQPSPMPIQDVPLRVQDAIAFVRGVTPEADLSHVTLGRGGKVYVLDLQAMYERGDVGQNWFLQDGDVVHVPDRARNKVYVLGEVRTPSSRLMVKGRMNLAEAIGDAAGVDPITSNPGAIYVVRGPYEQPDVYKLDASSPDALLLASRFDLQPQDVVFVASTKLTTWNRIVGQILPTIQLLWYGADTIYRAQNVGIINDFNGPTR
jgi:polysaccharide biosynthesis/export protein